MQVRLALTTLESGVRGLTPHILAEPHCIDTHLACVARPRTKHHPSVVFTMTAAPKLQLDAWYVPVRACGEGDLGLTGCTC